MGDATSNIIEGLHSESNTEGISCTLVGGVQRGQHIDMLKEKTLKVSIVLVDAVVTLLILNVLGMGTDGYSSGLLPRPYI